MLDGFRRALSVPVDDSLPLLLGATAIGDLPLDRRCSSAVMASETSVRPQRRSMNGTSCRTRGRSPGFSHDRPDCGFEATRRPGDGLVSKSGTLPEHHLEKGRPSSPPTQHKCRQE